MHKKAFVIVKTYFQRKFGFSWNLIICVSQSLQTVSLGINHKSRKETFLVEIGIQNHLNKIIGLYRDLQKILDFAFTRCYIITN